MDATLRPRWLRQLSFLSTSNQLLLLDYLAMLHARHYALSSLDNITSVIKRLVRHLPAARQALISNNLTLVTTADLDSLLAFLQTDGYAPATINQSFSLLGGFFAFLIENEQMLRQPVSKRRHRVFAPATLPKPMAEADLAPFFKVIDSIRDRALFLLMLRCGLRVSEACALSWQDVDWDAGTIRVNNGKGLIDRIAYLAPDLEQTLRLWRARNPAAEFLFPSRKAPTTHIKRAIVNLLMAQYLELAGITRQYSPHSLRHTFATQLLNAGVGLEVLKELLGHHSLQMTLRYAELYEPTKRQQYNDAMTRIEKRQAM